MFPSKSRQDTHAVTALFSALTVTAFLALRAVPVIPAFHGFPTVPANTAFHAFPAVPAITAALTPAASRYRFYLNEL